MVHQLLMQDCPECEYMMYRCHGCLLISRGVQFPPDLFPQIVMLHNHVTPYHDPKMGEDAPFITIGPFTSRDTLFPSTARDLDLYTTEEIITLKNMGIFKSTSTIKSSPKLPSLAFLSSPSFSK